jgi:hypothetical protein
VFCAEAAIELLIGHRNWLLRDDFVSEFVVVLEHTETERPRAFVDWAGSVRALESGRLCCSSSEGQMLRLAAGIVEGIAVDLREVVCGLDATNALSAARALWHAAGHGRTDLIMGESR